MADGMLRANIWLALHSLNGSGSVTLDDYGLTYNSDFAKGQLTFINPSFSGFESLNLDASRISEYVDLSSEDENGNNNVCLRHLSVENLEFSMDYIADLAIEQRIPIYGRGTFKISFLNVSPPEICLYVVRDGTAIVKYLDNLKMNIVYDHGEVELTGFLNYNYINDVVLQLTKILNVLIAMWNKYDPDGTSCLFDPFAQYIINYYKEYETQPYTFDTDCILKGTPFGDLTSSSYNNTFDFLLDAVFHYYSERYHF